MRRFANLVPCFLGDAVRIGRAQERRRKEAEEAPAASRVRDDYEAPSLQDEDSESSGYRDDIREDDPDANSEIDQMRW